MSHPNPHCSHLPHPLCLHDFPLPRAYSWQTKRIVSTEIIKQVSSAGTLYKASLFFLSDLRKLVKPWCTIHVVSILVKIHHLELVDRLTEAVKIAKWTQETKAEAQKVHMWIHDVHIFVVVVVFLNWKFVSQNNNIIFREVFDKQH